MATLITGDLRPSAGDLVLARVTALGKQTKLELTDGRRAHMFPGDEIVVSYGNRYAPDQFEAVVSHDLGPCDLVAAGGLAGMELSRHVRMLPPTQITPLGLIGDAQGERINLSRFRIEASEEVPDLPVVLSLGTSMNTGKTLTSTSLVRGFRRLGLKVAALKITGTGAGGDMWIVRDAGADQSLDFTDAGFASTYLVPIDEVEKGAWRLINHVAAQGCAVAVIEIADGLQQKETAQLIRNEALRSITLGCTFAAYDAMGAICGYRELVETGHNVLGLSGRIGMSPLGVREAEAVTGMRVYSPFELQDGALVPEVQRRAAQAFAASRFQRHSLVALAKAAMPVEAGPIALGQGADGPAAAAAVTADGRVTALPLHRNPAEQGREVLGRVAEYLMDQEIAACCGVGTASAGRTNRRNGFRRFVWASSLGPVDLKVPRLRQGAYAPSFLDAAIRPGEVEAVLRAPHATARDAALLGLLRSLGGPALGPADALIVASRVGHLVGDAAASNGPDIAAMPAPRGWAGEEGTDAAVMGIEEDEDDPADALSGMAGELPQGAERMTAEGGGAFAVPR
ncbi:transposase [Paracoccus sp. Z118]|uniref:transposase n=1 Tax=Paracoccus sp. Z118 TaxID=2851017 RepID=UPI001C2C7228|nr:transposase [Paracoccus sp. Z118]MBV0892943.1 transposase [Paracoccus sp. Z118]